MDVTVIAIAGASCSGKTTLATELSRRLGATLIRTDDYYFPLDHLSYDERCAINFDHPETIDSARLIADMRQLAKGRSTEIPRYDFTRHTRFSEGWLAQASPVVVVEGLFPLCYPELAHLCKIRVFVDAETEVCFARRLDRDVRERGRTPEEVHDRFYGHVVPMFHRYVEPAKYSANVWVCGKSPIEQGVEAVVSTMARLENAKTIPALASLE